VGFFLSPLFLKEEKGLKEFTRGRSSGSTSSLIERSGKAEEEVRKE